MHTLRTAAALATALLIAAGAATSHPARAAIHPDTASTFNIMALGTYCAGGGTGCSSSAGPEAYQALAWGFGAPGRTSGALVHAFAECDRYYTDANGHRIDAYLYAGNTAGDSVTIQGTGALGPNPDESNTASTGKLAFLVKDSTSGDTAFVVGNQTANNVTDKNVSGGFTIVLTGKMYGVASGASGSMTCSTAKLPPGTADMAENEYEPYDPSG